MIAPYYEHAGITIYHGDCREILPALPKFDALITDPPYGIGVSRKAFGSGRVKGGGFRSKSLRPYQPRQFVVSGWDDCPVADDLLEMCRGMANQSIIWGGNYFRLPPSARWLIWDKRNDGTDFADCEMAWTNQHAATRIFRWRWNGMLQEGKKELRLHPAMKPLALMKWCLTFVPKATSVLDPFMGSGTTLVAAKNLGLTAVGIELDEFYCQIAAKRLSQEVFDFQEGR